MTRHLLQLGGASVLAVLLAACSPLQSSSTRTPTIVDAPVSPGRADAILVEKGQRRLSLLQGGRVLKSYKVSLGRNPVGDKLEEGDGRTPEGDYFIDWRKPNSAYYKALHVSYPHRSDYYDAREAGRSPGGAIMIHGLPNKRPNATWMRNIDWTEGCIAVTNAEMDEIWRSVRDGTPIRIVP